jgi:REP element-mobilizing transposase RayT
MDKFQNIYRIPSNRRPNWDYSGNGAYFITLVTQNRICNLGEIVNNEMVLSDFGRIVKTEWEKSFDLRNELFVHEYILMPNHIHAIIILDKNEKNAVDGDGNVVAGDRNVVGQVVETHGRASLRSSHSSHPFPQSLQTNPSNHSTFIRKPLSISSFIAGFKSAVNSKIDDYIDQNNLNIPKYNRNNHFFQPNYYDHIIRDSAEFERIQNYIVNNPLNWKDDKFYA